ncbi:hypothetical protein DXA21_21965 [Parabacteroides distasonis]|nr:hypothetical protein DXA21_21965 [Parabacteroides distasonis]
MELEKQLQQLNCKNLTDEYVILDVDWLRNELEKQLQQLNCKNLTDEYVILDVDWLRNVAWPQNDEEENNLIEQIFYLTKDISQSKKAVVWTMAGGLDRLSRAYGKRFFSEIKVLALTAEPETIRKR